MPGPEAHEWFEDARCPEVAGGGAGGSQQPARLPVSPAAAGRRRPVGFTGVLPVVWITNHRKNGFFIFRPGEGYEYVMVLTAGGLLLPGTGAGRWSLDHATGIFDPPAGPRPGSPPSPTSLVGSDCSQSSGAVRGFLNQTLSVVPGGTELPSLLLDELVDRLRQS